jgi:STE24 endopeptidase
MRSTKRLDAPTDAAGPPGRLVLVLLIVAAVVVLGGVLAQVIRPVAPPIGDIPDPSRWFDAAHLERVEAYWAPLYAASALTLFVRVGMPLLIAFTPLGRRLVERLAARVGGHRPALAAGTIGVGMVVSVDVVLLPLAFWAGYLREKAYGFRTSGVAGWSYDWVAARAPGWIAVFVLLVAGYALAVRRPRTWAPLAALAGAVLTGLVVFAAPHVLEPLRHTTTPLPDGPVRTEVEAVLDAAGERADRILVADASRRTTRHNAYISGLGATRRVVLYDTLVAERPPDEVAMVVAHELGHQRNADLPRGTMAGAAASVCAVLAIWAFLRWRVRTGRQRSITEPSGAAAVVAFVVLLTTLSMPVESALSRRAEAAADLAALDITGDPDTFLAMNLELSRTNLSNPQPPTWVRLLWSSHPSTAERLAMGERWPFDIDDRNAAP